MPSSTTYMPNSAAPTNSPTCRLCHRNLHSETILMRSQRGKDIRYCSPQCELRPWGRHVQTSVSEAIPRSNDHMFTNDAAALAQSCKHWIDLHMNLFRWTCLQALYSPTDPNHISTHLLHVTIELRSDHGGMTRKWFRAVDIAVFPYAQAEASHAMWKQGIETFKRERVQRQRRSGGKEVLLIVHCVPFGAQFIEVRLSTDDFLSSYYEPSWREFVIADIEVGQLDSPLMRHCGTTAMPAGKALMRRM